MAKSELLIEKTNLALIDLTQNNSNVMWELTTLLKNRKHIILIANEGSIIDIQIKEHSIIYYKTLDDEDFLLKLQNHIDMYIKDYPFDGIEEAMRLFEKKEFNAASISAFRYLEESIRKSNIKLDNYSHHYSLNMMLQALYKNEILHNISFNEIKDYISLRNNLVHTNISINKSEAANVIAFVKKIVNELTSYIRSN
ncbi:MAG: hypothetical protein ACLTC4_05755 [Hungatella hathewayi]